MIIEVGRRVDRCVVDIWVDESDQSSSTTGCAILTFNWGCILEDIVRRFYVVSRTLRIVMLICILEDYDNRRSTHIIYACFEAVVTAEFAQIILNPWI